MYPAISIAGSFYYLQRMIDPQSLRIGNWLLYSRNGTEQFLRVINISSFSFTCEDSDIFEADKDLDCFTPIPLTPVLMEKCGFEMRVHTWKNGTTAMDCYWLGSFYVRYEPLGSYIGVEKIDGSAVFLKTVFTVHQLQNIYYALTGEELKVEP